MRDGYTVDVLTSVDYPKFVKIGGKAVQIYEGVIYRGNFKISSFKKLIENLFNLRLEFKDECNDLMQGLVKLNMNYSYCGNVRKDTDEEYKCKPEYWMQSEYYENVLEYLRLKNGE